MQRENSNRRTSRARGEGGDGENVVRSSLPFPEDVSLPWNESLSDIANRSSQRSIVGEERLASSVRAMGNEPLRERRRWFRPQTLALGYQQTDSPPLCTCAEESNQVQSDDSRKPFVTHHQSKPFSDDVSVPARKFGMHHCANRPYHEADPLLREHFGCSGNSPPTENIVDDRFHCGSMTDSPVAARIPSPSSASSVTSGRRLEWDSGADVGYQNSHLEEKCSEVGLSTIERIALARGCSAALFERMDPEGTTGSGKKIKSFQGSHISFNSPQAKSTPVYQAEYGDRSAAYLRSKSENLAPEKCLLPGGYLYVHSSEDCENEGTPILEDSATEKKKESGNNSDDLPENATVSLKKHSTSLTDLKNLGGDNAPQSLPRSQSYLNMLTRENRTESSGVVSSGLPSSINPRMLGAAYSASSSSVATIVQKPVFSRTTSNKLVQTLPIKASIGVQTSLTSDDPNSENSVKEDLHIRGGERSVSKSSSCQNSSSNKVPSERMPSEKAPSEKAPSEKALGEKALSEKGRHICTGAHKKGSTLNGSSCSSSSQNTSSRSQITSSAPVLTSSNIKEFEAKHTSDKGSGTLDSATSSTHTAASSCAAETSYSGIGLQAEFRRESVGVVDSAHSFEYLPGHVYETGLEACDTKSKASSASENSINKSSEHKSEKSEISDKECSSLSSASLAKDIEDSVKLLRELVAGKAFNSKAKKTLLRKIVNKLVDSDYKDDYSGSELSMPLSSNLPCAPTASSSKPVLSGSMQPKTAWKSIVHSSGCPRLMKLCSSSCPEEQQRVDAPSRNSSSVSSCMPSGSVSVPGDNEESNVESHGFSSRSPSDRAGMDWKLATTRSEREFEKARSQSSLNSNSSSLMRFCKTEREKQLHWIRFEIDHLNNLKQLLEKQEGLTKSLSNLTAHEHKYHKRIKSKSSKPASTCREQRVEEVATPGSDFRESEHSACIHCQHKCHVPSDGSVKIQPSSSIESREWNAKNLKYSGISETNGPRRFRDRKGISDKEDAHDMSLQTLTLDSYTLSNADGANQESKDRCINVYSQTSPRAKCTQVHKDSQTSLPRVRAEEANQNYHLATKCCCECRKAFEEILEKGVGRQKASEELEKMSTSCGCQTDTLTLNKKRRDDSEISNVGSSSLSTPNESDASRNNKNNRNEEASLRRQTNVATETVDSKGSQTSGSLKKLPIIRPAWYMTEIHEATERQTSNREVESRHNHEKGSNDVCLCCGLLVNQAQVNRKSSTQSNSSFGPQSSKSSGRPNGDAKQQTVASIPQSKTSSAHDVSAQTELQKSPLAYLLTFEPTAKENIRKRGRTSLPEIKIFVPPPDLNTSKKDGSSSKQTNTSAKENSLPPSWQSKLPCKLVEVEVEGHEKKMHVQTLQEYLKANRPEYLDHADKRTKCLADLAVLRELRKQKRLELLAMTPRKEAAGKPELAPLRPAKSWPSVPKRLVLSKQEMREHAERNYRRSNEVQSKLAERKKKEDFRTNRLMAELFTKKLQKKVLQGVVNHSNSASVISSI